MNTALRHRGPDDQDLVEIHPQATTQQDCRLFLGNTRLAIIDTSFAGHQPMHDPQTGNWITYNGETYNFETLRDEIGDEFGPWKSKTDTEVVLRAYRKWGIDFLSRLRGMYAFAIWDSESKQLILARDSFGIKPLYYAQIDSSETDTKHFLFASELRALLRTNLVPAKLSRQGVASFLGCGSIASPLTIVDGVKSLGAGQHLTVGITASRKFAVTLTTSPRKRPDFDVGIRTRADAVSALREQLESSIRSHLISDVSLGIFLSGGMDSSALVGLMSQVNNQRPRTFTVVFEEDNFNEESHANFVASKFRTEHSDILVTEDHLINVLPQALAALDQPTIDGINTYVISQAVKNTGVTVALSGLGGDELFGGYPSFWRAWKLGSLPAVARRMLQATASVSKLAFKDSVRARKFSELAASELTPTDIYRVSRQLFSEAEAAQLKRGNGHPVGPSDCDAEAPASVLTESRDWINAISQLELSGYMSNTLLRDTDSTSMANSLEVRVPFVDVALVDFVLSLPGNWKVDSNRPDLPKVLLADAVNDLLPTSFLTRPKMGFTLPFERWLPDRLHSTVANVLEDKIRIEDAGLEYPSVRKVWRQFLESPATVGWSRPWALYVLAKWCEQNGVGAGDASADQ